MEWVANLIYWVFGAFAVAGLGVIAFLWERMRRDLNLALPPQQKISLYPSLPVSFKRNELGHFINVLDQYEEVYPHSALPKNLALGVVVWILCFMAMLASGVGR